MSAAPTDHVVERLWTRAQAGGVMEPRTKFELITGEGIRGDHTYGRMRHITLVFADDWQAATAELGQDVDPVGRRANVLLRGGDGLALVGRTVALGAARIEIRGETRPCPVMDQAVAGGAAARGPRGRVGPCRSGRHGEARRRIARGA